MSKAKPKPHDDLSINLQLLHLGCEAPSSWMNLGFWSQVELEYPDACRALARRLGENAQLNPGHSILDIGCGCGEQLVFWRDVFQAGPIHGVDPSPGHLKRARALTAGLRDITLEETTSSGFTQKEQCYDRVLCLDSAYHFKERSQFFLRAFQSLKGGGALALSDLILDSDSTPYSRVRNACARLCGIPPENILSVHQYRSQLEESGFTDIKIDFVSEDVLGGFANFVERVGRSHSVTLFQVGWLKIWLTARVCRWFRKQGTIHYALITARKGL